MTRHLKDSISISRDLKIDEDSKDNLRYSEIPLQSVTKKFLKEPLTVESVDKKFRQMYESSKRDDDSSLKPKKKKKHEEKAIFYDIFVKPKENKIKEIIDRRNQKNLAASVTIPSTRNKIYISNKITIEGKVVGMNININGPKVDYSSLSLMDDSIRKKLEKERKEKKLLNESYKNSELLQTNLSSCIKSDEEFDTTLLNKLLHKKFIITKISSDESKKNYFNQLIQIRPPEGINAVSASPLMDSSGWAPSIPSLDIEKINTNLKELLTRAKGGIKAGDITKESHMAFYLGIMYENEKKYDQALKFYKKFFLSAKLLQDIYGTELALNRIGVLYSNIQNYKQSLYYNEKHKEISTHNLNSFVAFYNCGLCHRILEDYEHALQYFEGAIRLAEEENDLESYTLCLAQLAITNLFLGYLNEFITYSNDFFSKNKTLNHKDMELEMQLLNGYVNNYCGNFDVSKDFYKKSLMRAANISNEDKVRLSLCNIGCIDAERDINDYVNCISENKEWNKGTEPEVISAPQLTTKTNKSKRYDTHSQEMNEQEYSDEYYKVKKTDNSTVSKKKDIKDKKKKNYVTRVEKKEQEIIIKSKIKGNKAKKKEIPKKKEKKEEVVEMIGGGVMIGDEEEEVVEMIGGGVMIGDEEEEIVEMVGGGVMIGDEEEEVVEMIGGGVMIGDEDEEVVEMVGGGVMIGDEEEEVVEMVGGGVMIGDEEEELVEMSGGGVMIDNENENKEDVIEMSGGGVMIDNENENKEDVIEMSGGGVMIDNENENKNKEDAIEMSGGGVMIDNENENKDEDIEMSGGGVMIDNENENKDEDIEMSGGGVMIDNENENKDEDIEMSGGGVMIDNENDENQFKEPEEVD